MAVRSKGWVCGHLPAEIMGLNPAGGMDVCLLRVLSGRGLCNKPGHSSRGVLRMDALSFMI